MEVEHHEEHSFIADLLISKSCNNPSCRRVSEHASRLMHAAALLKTYLIQQHQNQTPANSQIHFDATNAAVLRSRTDYTALQRQVEVGLSYQREVQQLRKELEFHRETIENYKQLVSDGKCLRDELHNELALARKSASIARATQEQEKRCQIRQTNLVTSGPLDNVNRWLEIYKEENTTLRESIRSLTNNEMKLSELVSRVKDYVGEEVERCVKSKGSKKDLILSGQWFLGLLGLLGLACPSELEYRIAVPSASSSSPSLPRQSSKSIRHNASASKLVEKKFSALESVISELDEVGVDAAVQTPTKMPTLRRNASFISASPSNSKKTRSLRLFADDAPSLLHSKNQIVSEIAVCNSPPNQKVSSPAQSVTESAFEDVNSPLHKSAVDLDDAEASSVTENRSTTECIFSSPVLRPSSSDSENESDSSEESDVPLSPPMKKSKINRQPCETMRPVPQTHRSALKTRSRKLISLPSTLADIITSKFSKPIFDWFNDLTTYEVSRVTSSKATRSSEDASISPSPVTNKSKCDLPLKSSIPLGSCVGMESGIVSTPQPQSLLDNLTAQFAGQRRPFDHPSASKITMDVVCEALIRALELAPKSNSNLPLSPPDPVLRAASLLKAIGKPLQTSAFTTWFRVRLHAKKRRRCLPRSPQQIYRLAQTAFLACDPSQRVELLYQLALFLLFNRYSTAPISCLLLAFRPDLSTPVSRLDTVYQFLSWEEEEAAEVSTDAEEFISNLRKVSGWSQAPTVTSLRDLVSTLVDDFCYEKAGDLDDTSKALRLILTARAFTNLEANKSSIHRFGLLGWVLKARLLNWIHNLVKCTEEDESSLRLLLRVSFLSVDLILLAVQLDSRHFSSTSCNKKPSACQRGVLECCERLFEFLVSLLATASQHIDMVINCLLRLVPCLDDARIARLRELLSDLSADVLLKRHSIGIHSSILPPLQKSFIDSSLERLQLPSNKALANWLREILSPT